MKNQINLAGLVNRSILIVDDNHALHRDYYAVLRPDQNEEDESKLDELEELLLGSDNTDPSPRIERNFDLQSVYQGEEALALVTKHLKKGIRYPLAFIDMRMPPGWDGLHTIEQIRAVDPDIFFVIVSAYSDYTEEDIVERLGEGTKVKLVCKPFEPAEIYQLSFDILADWNAKNPVN